MVSVTITSFGKDGATSKTKQFDSFNDAAKSLETFLQSIKGGVQKFLAGTPHVIQSNDGVHVIDIRNNEGKRVKMPKSLRDGGTKWVDTDTEEQQAELLDADTPTIVLSMKDGTLEGILGIAKVIVVRR